MRRLTWAALAAGLLLLTPTGSAQIIDPPGFGVAITAQGTACTTAGRVCADSAVDDAERDDSDRGDVLRDVAVRRHVGWADVGIGAGQ
jgi:hypothetical protein